VVFQFCPVCGCQRWKTYVNPQTGGWYCHAPEHSGGGKIDIGQPIANRGQVVLSRLQGKDACVVAWSEVSLPKWEPLSNRAIRYLAKRRISREQATRLGIVEMEDRMRVIVPYYGREGEIIYWTARSYSNLEEGPKYLAASGRHPLYVRPGWHQHDTLVLVEGVFDAIAVHQETGMPVAAIGGKALPRYLDQNVLDLSARRLVVLLDGDALADAIKIKRRFTPRRQVDVVPLPVGQDPSDLGSKLKELM